MPLIYFKTKHATDKLQTIYFKTLIYFKTIYFKTKQNQTACWVGCVKCLENGKTESEHFFTSLKFFSLLFATFFHYCNRVPGIVIITVKLKRTTYMWKLRNCLLPAFNPLDVTTLPTWCIRQNLRSCDIFFDSICHTQKLERSIIKTASKDWNSLPKELRGLKKKKTFPKESKKFYNKTFSDSKQYTTYEWVSWKSIRFKKFY